MGLVKMPSNRNILRGTLRLSLVAAVLAVAFGVYVSTADYIRAYSAIQHNARVKAMLECGSRISDDELKAALDEYGLIDLSKVGCSDKRTSISFTQLDHVRSGTMEWAPVPPVFSSWRPVIGYPVMAFMLVNLFGFALVTVLVTSRWVSRGFKPS